MFKSVFISYCHSDMDKAEYIDSVLTSVGIRTVRDVRDVKAMGDLKSFMERVSECDYVILVLSKKYLESYNCLYELLELARDRTFINKTHAFALEDANIFSEEGRLDYVKYWTRAYENLHKDASELELDEITSATRKLKIIRTIRINIGEFLEELSEHKLYTQTSDLTELIEQIGIPDFTHYPKLVEAVAETDMNKKSILIDQFLIENPENILALILKGELEIGRRQFESAEYFLTAAIKKNPGAWLAYAKLGDVYYHLGKLSASELSYMYSIEKNDSDPSVYSNLAITLQAMNKLEDAEKYFRKAVELDPMNSEWHRNLGVFLDTKLSKSDEAESAYRTAIKLNQSDYTSYNNLATLLYDSGDHEKAEEILNQLVLINPIHENGLLNLVDLKIILNKTEDILESIVSYIALRPFDYNQVFGWLDNLSKTAAIIDDKAIIDEMERLNRRDSGFYFAHGEYLEVAKNSYEEANLKYLTALELDPDADMLVDYSIFLNEHHQDLSPLFGSGRSVRILKNLRQALELDPNNQRAMHMFTYEYEKSPHRKYSEQLREWMRRQRS